MVCTCDMSISLPKPQVVSLYTSFRSAEDVERGNIAVNHSHLRGTLLSSFLG